MAKGVGVVHVTRKCKLRSDLGPCRPLDRSKVVIFLDFAIDCAFSGNSGSSVKFVGEVPRRGEEDVEALSATLLIHLRSHCEVLQALPVVQHIVRPLLSKIKF